MGMRTTGTYAQGRKRILLRLTELECIALRESIFQLERFIRKYVLELSNADMVELVREIDSRKVELFHMSAERLRLKRSIEAKWRRKPENLVSGL